jgi:hypothetical protein
MISSRHVNTLTYSRLARGGEHVYIFMGYASASTRHRFHDGGAESALRLAAAAGAGGSYPNGAGRAGAWRRSAGGDHHRHFAG